MVLVDTAKSKQLLQIEQKFVKNPNWQEADQFALYKAWKSQIWDNQTQIHAAARWGGFDAGTSGLQVQFPNPLGHIRFRLGAPIRIINY